MMTSMEAAHGHEKKHGQEGFMAKHLGALKGLKEPTVTGLTALGIGAAAMVFAPALLAAAGIILPASMVTLLGMGSAGVYLKNKLSPPKKDKEKEKHADHGGHH